MQEQHAVLITGLPAAGVTEGEVLQFMTFCGDVDTVYLFLAQQMSTTAAHPATSTAFVCFKNASSVAYAELLSGSLFKGKVIHIQRSESAAGAAETDNIFSLASEPTSGEETTVKKAASDDPPETMTGLYLRARMQRAAQAVRFTASQVAVGAREQVAKVKQGALSLEVRAVHAVHDVREMREYVPVYGNGPTRQQYDYTPTQPQWGEKPSWLRAPSKKAA